VVHKVLALTALLAASSAAAGAQPTAPTVRIDSGKLAGTAKDGMMTGPNYDATRKLAQAGRVPVIASGGIGTIAHVAETKTTGAWGCIVGRSLYEGTVDLRQALKLAAE